MQLFNEWLHFIMQILLYSAYSKGFRNKKILILVIFSNLFVTAIIL